MIDLPWVTLLFIFVLCIFQFYKDKLKTDYCNFSDEIEIANIRMKKYFTTHLIHAGSVFGHFLPNVLLTFILGTMLENIVGSFRMLTYILISIFVYWPLVYYFIRTYREGCGFSSIYFSFVSIYFSILVLFERDFVVRVLFAFMPFLFLFIINYVGENIVKLRKSSSNIHILSIVYGYFVGVAETIIYYWK
jgi:hypothetical protein